ncbi:hypothetical protein SporoP8_12100 [Sporosarcina ureae]|uniref:hypothetical protein n=1 Tax=Sporosarcina ureae TaxID=1571 RepID=UPI000A15406E|nr:hypothetical protein [Sporosarcina ureae]ARJ39551.1 hypothetical protein SporoP8_12100 [Sporosarcina ureae]
MKIINLIIIILPIPLFLTEHSIFCWLAVFNAVSYMVMGLIIPYLIAKSAMDKFKSTIDMLEQKGATPIELEKVFQAEVVITEQDYQAVAIWIYYISLSYVLIGAILCSIDTLFYSAK